MTLRLDVKKIYLAMAEKGIIVEEAVMEVLSELGIRGREPRRVRPGGARAL